MAVRALLINAEKRVCKPLGWKKQSCGFFFFFIDSLLFVSLLVVCGDTYACRFVRHFAGFIGHWLQMNHRQASYTRFYNKYNWKYPLFNPWR